MFPPNKKKPGLTVGIMVGKPKDDLGEPESPDEKSRMREPEPEPEEVPEQTESYSADLLSDMMKPLVDAGMEEGDARETLAAQFEAAAACLRGKRGGEEQIETEEPPMERYGR